MQLIIAHGDVVTMNPAREVLVGGAVLIDGDVVAAVGSSTALITAHPHAEVLDARGCIVTPGMINAHQHLTGDPLVRSCIPDLLPAGAAIFEWAVPIHGAHSPDDDEMSATLCALESVLNGVTTLVEAGTVAYPDRVVAGMQAVGTRGTIGTWGWDIEDGPFAAPADEVLARQRAVVERYPAGGLVEGWVTLVGHDLASDALLAGAADLARSMGTHMTMHLSPTSSDPEQYLARTGRRPVVHLQHLGVLGPHLLLAHGVWLDDEEIELVLASRTAIAYCPWAYLRLGQGVTRAGRHADIVERGGRVALGCDSANAGDVADILRAAAARRRHRPRHPARPRTVRRPRRVRAGDHRRRRGDRHGRPNRLARAREAGGHRRAPRRWLGLVASRRCRAAAGLGHGRAIGPRRVRGRSGGRARRALHHDRCRITVARRRRCAGVVAGAGRHHRAAALAPHRCPLSGVTSWRGRASAACSRCRRG